MPSAQLTPEERDERNRKARKSASCVKAGVAPKRPRVVLPTEEEEDEPPTAGEKTRAVLSVKGYCFPYVR